MANEINGNAVLVIVNVGTAAAPQWQPVASQRNVDIDESRALIDVSSKESDDEKTLPGRYTGRMTLSALYVPGSPSYNQLKSKMRNGDQIKLRIREFGADIEEANATLTRLGRGFPDQGAATVTAEFNVEKWASP